MSESPRAPSTIREAAARLRLNAGTVYQLVAAGQIRSVRVGPRRGRILVPEDAIDEYLRGGERRQAEPKAPPPKATGFKRLGI